MADVLNNMHVILLKRIGHFECSNIYDGRMVFNYGTSTLMKRIGHFKIVYVFNNIMCILLKSICHIKCSDVYVGTYILLDAFK